MNKYLYGVLVITGSIVVSLGIMAACAELCAYALGQ